MRDKALAPMRAMIAASRAEPGCLAYSFAFDAEDDHLVRVFECFADTEAAQAHRDSEHMRAWRAAWDEAGIGDRAMMRYAVTARETI